MIKFKTNEKYYMRSACDHECIWTFTVKSQVGTRLTLTHESGKETMHKIHNDGESEFCYPLGIYSMQPILRASKQVEQKEG